MTGDITRSKQHKGGSGHIAMAREFHQVRLETLRIVIDQIKQTTPKYGHEDAQAGLARALQNIVDRFSTVEYVE